MKVQWPKGSNLHSTFVSALLQPRYHDFPTYLEAKSLILVFCSGFPVFWHVCASLCLSCVNSRLLYVLECGLGWCKCGLHKPIITFPSDSCHRPARPVSRCCSVNCIPAHIATYITDRPPRWHGPWEIITLLISIGYTGFMCNLCVKKKKKSHVISSLSLILTWFRWSLSFEKGEQLLLPKFHIFGELL